MKLSITRLVAIVALATVAVGCDDGPLNVGGFCSSASDCPAGQLCKDGACTSTCATDAECQAAGLGVTCDNGTCGGGKLLPLIETPETIDEGAEVLLDASKTVYLGQGALTYQWEQVAGPPVPLVDLDQVIAKFTTPPVVEPTPISFEVTVSDGESTETGLIELMIANSINEAPTAALVGPTEPVAGGTLVELDATGSADPNPGDSLLWTWEPADLVTPAKDGKATFAAPVVEEDTDFIVKVTVSDGTDEATASMTIHVLASGTGCDGSCDDGNPCTKDTCDAKAGCTHEALDGAACDDGDACTIGETCGGTECKSGGALDCDDGNPCTEDTCATASGCDHAPTDGTCSDGNGCTHDDHCEDGACVAGETDPCDDGNPCTQDACVADTCTHDPLSEGACDDGDACTTLDTCADGTCVGGGAPACDDGNPCTDDACDTAQGCTHAANTAPCDDGDPCTKDDACGEGICLPGPLDEETCGCAVDTDCADLEDGDYCNGTLFCDTSQPTPVCAVDPSTVVFCDATKDSLCEKQTCEPTSGICLTTPIGDGTSCDDGNECTQGDVCGEGACKGVEVICDDGNPCTVDACDPTLGCTSTFGNDPCDDGNPCTTNDVCNNGACAGSPVLCSDTNPCTKDFCDPESGCVYEATDAPCDDGNPCTAADVCKDTVCIGTTETLCDDGNPCTDDACEAELGCVTTSNTEPCDDGNACTIDDACSEGLCQGAAPLACDDGNPCTDDGCDENGCAYTNNTSGCEDGNPCTQGDTCLDGACAAGEAVVCDDNNPCTDDACGDAGCTYVPNTAACDDGNECTIGDGCSDGACVSELAVDCYDGNPCTDDTCDPVAGCVHTPGGGACDDGNACTQGESCVEGACTGGTSVTCSDGNACTDDSCNPAVGCEYKNNSAGCDDGNLCTSGDTCSGGECKGPFVTNCDDTNPCTSDSCAPQSGCKHANNSNPCDDGDACTVGDACASGTCSGKPMDCDDGNSCTLDSCDKANGCQHGALTGPCDDGNSCTTADTCSGGKCVGVGQVCDDGNPCTDDACDGTGACVFTPNTKLCNDGNACTSGDRCDAGACSGEMVLCNDGNPCTNDACNPATGCSYTNNTLPCSDGNACTAGDKCANGKCAAGAVVSCNDDNPCTNDACDPTTGCIYKNNAATCDDGNKCTTDDKCVAGKCLAASSLSCADNNPCTNDSCDPAVGCVFANNTLPCDDGNACTTADACSAGACKGANMSCNDNNPCTNDSCNPASGCVYANNSASCNDASACTTADTCTGGKCVGTAIQCPVGGQCEWSGCDATTGCVLKPVTGVCAGTNDPCQGDGDCAPGALCKPKTCDDGNLCTAGDQCKAGACGGSALSCDDGNPCTTDSCTPDGGCVHAVLKNGSSCSDGSVCTVNDVCINGACTGAPKCDDGNACTADLCDPKSGLCTNTPSTGSCNDGNACTTKDTCLNGQCIGSTVNCDDGNTCTLDSCSAKLGCVYQNEAFGKACSNGPYGTCWDGTCQAWEIATTTPTGYNGGALHASHTPPGGSLDAAGAYYNTTCSLFCFTTYTPTVFGVNKSTLQVAGKAGAVPGFAQMYDANGYLAVGAASGGTANWTGSAWSFAGGPDFNVGGFSAPTFTAVGALTSGTVTSHWLGGPYATGSSFLSLLRRCDRGVGGWGKCDIMPVVHDSTGTGCSQQIKFTANEIWAAGTSRVIYAGWTHDQIEGDPYGWPTIATWNGNSYQACGQLSGYKGEVYVANDPYAFEWTKKTIGATFETVGGSSTSNVWVGGKEGTLFRNDGAAWAQVNPATSVGAFNSNFDIRSILATDTELHIVGDGMGVVGSTCNDTFYLHGVKSGTSWKFDRLIKFSSNVYACGSAVTESVRLQDIRFDAATGDLVVVGWKGESTSNPTKALPLVMRLKKPSAGTLPPINGAN